MLIYLPAPQVVISGLRLTDPQTDKSADPAFLKVMTWAGDLHLHIDQILVVLETTLESNLCAVQMGVAKIDSDMTLLQHDKGSYSKTCLKNPVYSYYNIYWASYINMFRGQLINKI